MHSEAKEGSSEDLNMGVPGKTKALDMCPGPDWV